MSDAEKLRLLAKWFNKMQFEIKPSLWPNSNSNEVQTDLLRIADILEVQQKELEAQSRYSKFKIL